MASEEKMIQLQYQMRENQHELDAFLKDMNSWEDDIKKKENELGQEKPMEEKLPPVRNSLQKKKKKRVKTKQAEEKPKPKKLSGYDFRAWDKLDVVSILLSGDWILCVYMSGYDFRAWDKLDVDKLCEEIDKEEKKSSSEYETDEEWELERRKQQAIVEKDMGNDFFKRGEYENAIESYTRGLNHDPSNPILPANRAMALLKQEKYAAAEVDCITALTLDPLYVKAYLRLGAARFGLRKFLEAKDAYEKALQLEPQNKTAQQEIGKIEKELSKAQMVTHSMGDVGLVKPISKHVAQRSKKPLRRLDIEEIGVENDSERQTAIARVQEGQSQAKKRLEAQDGASFEKFTSQNSTDSKKQSVIASSSKDNQPKAKSVIDKSDASNDKVETQNMKSEHKKNSSSMQASTSPRPSAGSTSPRSLGVPTSSYQFQADYKVLKRDQDAFYQYMKEINPEHYPKLLGQSLDADILMQFLRTFKEYFIP
ncbi:hypothetical protein FSP39_024146 [Pinctada imbricata]|uniref:RNA polymerase II-associated protein 3 n=1 Tax=Pinctada imbricata TaxID=66713 RepID=A0AA88YM32_PINIB|nr:hypothetical protein FSP39_024146 [Pinctada imbricata]